MVYNDGEREADGSSSVDSEDVYKERVEPVLVSSSDLYSELESISVDISGPFSYSTLHYLLTTFYLLSLREL